MLINKIITYYLVDFVMLADHGIKQKENEKQNKYMDLARDLKKAVEHEGDSDGNCCWVSLSNPKKPEKEIRWSGA